MPKERRIGTADINEKLGYISGQLDALHPKMDSMRDDVKANASKIAHVEKKVDRHRNIALGAGTVLTALIGVWTAIATQYEKIKHFFVGASS